MYVKWIVCSVKKEQRKAFSNAQEKWIEIQKAEGFVGQAGGWDINNENEACIISFWENRESLEFFMKNIHDTIFFGNKQSETYETISVKYFESKSEIKGSAFSLTEAIRNGKSLQITNCSLNPVKKEHFEKMLKTVCLLGMKKSKGMLGGLFSKPKEDNSHFLVSTFWDSIETHNDYVKNQLPILQTKSNMDLDIDRLTGRQVLLTDSWRILKK